MALLHGGVQFLPCCTEPRCVQPRGPAAEEYRLALSLRCRLRLQCCLRDGCLVPEGTRRKFGYVCDLARIADEAESSRCFHDMPECDVLKYYNEGNGLPAPPPRLRKFLCNNQCPQQCCTTACPWVVVPRFSKCCGPGLARPPLPGKPYGGVTCACGFAP